MESTPVAWYIHDGYEFYDRGDYASAIKEFTKGIAANPSDEGPEKIAELYQWRGHSYRFLEKYDDSIADLDKAIEINPVSHSAFHDRAVTYEEQGKIDLAIPDFTRAIELCTDDKYTYKFYLFGRASAYKKQEKYKLAIADLNELIKLSPEDKYYFDRAESYAHLGNYDSAAADYSKVIELNPQMLEAHEARAKVYHNAEKHNLALADEKSSQKIKDSAETPWILNSELDSKDYFERGKYNFKNGKINEAISDFTKAAEIFHQNKETVSFGEEEIYHYRGVSYSLLDKLDLALADFTKAINMNDFPDAETCLARAEVYQRLGEESLAELDKELAISKLLTDAAAMYEYNDNLKAIDTCAQVIELNPQEVDAYWWRGRSYLDEGDIESAIADFDKVIELDPKDKETLQIRANAKRRLNRRQ